MRRTIILSINTSWNLLNFRQGLIRYLQAHNYHIVTLAPHDTSSSKLRDLGCEVVDFPMASQGLNPFQDLWLWWRYRRLFKKFRPAAFLGWTIKPNIYGSLAAHGMGIPVINNISGLGSGFLAGGWLSWTVQTLYKIALKKSHRVFFQNPDDHALFLKKALTKSVQSVVLPGSGVDLIRFSPAPRIPPSSRPFRFLMIARLLRDKGALEYFSAARELRAAGQFVQCQFLGFVDSKNPTAIPIKEFEDLIAQGIVEYLGTTDDVRPFIAQSDCVVLPSYREGTPRTLLEAAAMARPVIATNVPGCREVVVDEGNGFLCEAKSSSSLLQALLRMKNQSEQDWQRMASASRMLVESRYDEHVIFEHYSRALLELK